MTTGHGGNDNSKPNGELIDGENGSNSQNGRGQLTGRAAVSQASATGVVGASHYKCQQLVPARLNFPDWESQLNGGRWAGNCQFLSHAGLARGKQH